MVVADLNRHPEQQAGGGGMEPPSKRKKRGGGDGEGDDDDAAIAANDDDAAAPDDDAYVRLGVYGEHKRAVSSVKFAPSRICKSFGSGGADGGGSSPKGTIQSSLVASASASAFIKVWDLKPEYFEEALSLKSKKGSGSIRPSALGAAAAAGAGAGDNSNSNRRALQHCTLCLGHSRGINELAWNPVSPLLASASDDKTVRLWDAVTGDSLVEFKGHDNFVFCVDQHHATVVSGSFDETVKLWDIRSGDCVSTLPAHSDPVTAVSFNRDGTCVCSASHDGLIRIWDVATGECLKTIFAAGNPPVSSVHYSPNGRYLLAGTLDSCLRLWPVNRSSHRCAKTYRDPTHRFHVNTRYSVASMFMHDGNVVTGSETGDVVIYDVQTRKIKHVLGGGHTGCNAHNPTVTHGQGSIAASAAPAPAATVATNNNSNEENTAETSTNAASAAAAADNAVLAVSAHDTLPIVASGGMTNDRKVEFWVRRDAVGADDED